MCVCEMTPYELNQIDMEVVSEEYLSLTSIW